MAKTNYSYEKRQQELKKQKKRQEKLKKKQDKKLQKENGILDPETGEMIYTENTDDSEVESDSETTEI